MREYLISRLSEITNEEKEYLGGREGIKEPLYFPDGARVIEKESFAKESRKEPVMLRTHTRFIDFPEHSHDFIEMMFVCRGSVVHRLCGRELVLDGGKLLIMNRHVRHSLARAGKGDIGINLMVDSGIFESMIDRIDRSSPFSDFIIENIKPDGAPRWLEFDAAALPPAENIIESMIYLLLERNKDCGEGLLLKATEFLVACLSEHGEILVGSDHPEQGKDRFIRQVEDYASVSYRDGSLSELAAQMGFSEAYLSRKITRSAGRSFGDILRDRRFAVTLQLLRATDLSVDEIAEAVGYENKSYFYREFKRRFDTTPSRWKRQNSLIKRKDK